MKNLSEINCILSSSVVNCIFGYLMRHFSSTRVNRKNINYFKLKYIIYSGEFHNCNTATLFIKNNYSGKIRTRLTIMIPLTLALGPVGRSTGFGGVPSSVWY
jgi:hypothetical protein